MTDYRATVPEIAAYIDSLTIVDTHEHLSVNEAADAKDLDLLGAYLLHYMSSDLISAGLPPEKMPYLRDSSAPLLERWALAAPYWEACRFTGYGRALDICAQGIYDFPRIDGDTIEGVNRAFLSLHGSGGAYKRVLKDLSNIRTSVVDCYTLGQLEDLDRSFFCGAFNIATLVAPRDKEELQRTAQEAKLTVRSFKDWLEVCDATLQRAWDLGAKCLKCALAYSRSLHYPRGSFGDAEADFNSLLAQGRCRSFGGQDMQNYLMHHVLRLAERKGCAIQFHTGLQEGNGNLLANSDPLLLSNLLLDYPRLRFDIFHMSYPFMGSAGALAKNFPNAFIDMCWGHIISPRASMLALDEWLDAVPYTKISAFGGDYCFVDGVYGHQRMARDNVAMVLSRKVLAHELNTDAALTIAGALFVDNPARILGV